MNKLKSLKVITILSLLSLFFVGYCRALPPLSPTPPVWYKVPDDPSCKDELRKHERAMEDRFWDQLMLFEMLRERDNSYVAPATSQNDEYIQWLEAQNKSLKNALRTSSRLNENYYWDEATQSWYLKKLAFKAPSLWDTATEVTPERAEIELKELAASSQTTSSFDPSRLEAFRQIAEYAPDDPGLFSLATLKQFPSAFAQKFRKAARSE